jgi:parallel beta-helix repeat protein
MRARLFLESLEGRDLLSTYFVATTGTDGAVGSSATPWATLQFAVDHVKAGDVIEVESGTYLGCRIGNNGNFNSNSGTAPSPITLEAAAGAAVVVDAPGPNNYHGSDIEVENFSSTVQYWTIKGIECKDAPENAGIDIRTAAHITVEDCTCTYNYNWGIFTAFSNYVTLLNNTCSYSINQHGIYCSNSSSYITVEGNTCDNNKDCGIQFNGDLSQGGNGLMSNNLIAGNILYDNGANGGAALNFDGLENSTIENNLLYNNQAGGIVLYHADAAKGSQNNIVINNTIYMPAGSRWAININAGSTANVLYDNIIYCASPSTGCIEISSNSLTGFVSNYNIFNGSSVFSVNDGSSTISLAKWQAKGYDTHLLTESAAALWVNVAQDNFMLAASSPALHSGTTKHEPATDIDGTARSKTSDDIGCYV